ncbi:MAG: hypothetical protein IJ439_03225 [Tyzzerella sp.]|nr:hypothetical protein [Tyzzerella sp.]
MKYKIAFSGGDMHRADDSKLGNAGVVFDRRVKNMQEFLDAIRSQKYGILVEGKEYDIH